MFDRLKKKLGQVKEKIVGKIVSKPEEEIPEAKVEAPEKLLEAAVPEEKLPAAEAIVEVPEPTKADKVEVPAPEIVKPKVVEKPKEFPVLREAVVLPTPRVAEKPAAPPPPAPKKATAAPFTHVHVAPPEAPKVAKPKAPKVLAPEKPKIGIKRAVKRILGRELSASDVEDIVWDLQIILLESDVAVPVTDHIIERVKAGLVGKKIGMRDDPKELAEGVLKRAITEVLEPKSKVDILSVVKAKKVKGEPAIIVFVGINGTGKTTTIAKVAKYLSVNGLKPVLAAADTFRAAGIEQLEIHAQRLGMEVVKQKRGSDAAAVAYDAIAHAKARGMDVVLVDTAGRMQTDANLMDEMKKIIRVAKPDLVIFIGDALTGNDAVEQAKTFDQAVGIHGSILCKMDADARGGAALSISYVTGKPIIFIGTGQSYGDLMEFKPDMILNALFGD
ncbi:MAG: signal recognition particle-docking protein FtsY [Candidatus Hadarchaeota archaeon]